MIGGRGNREKNSEALLQGSRIQPLQIINGQPLKIKHLIVQACQVFISEMLQSH